MQVRSNRWCVGTVHEKRPVRISGGISEVFGGFPQSLPVHTGIGSIIWPRPLPTTAFPIHYSFIVLAFNAIQSVTDSVINSFKPNDYFISGFNNEKHFTFCPHSVFVCFVWISEQTAITSLP